MTQAGVLEHLKIENVTLSHQLTETQHRTIKEKERIAVQLQNIEVGHVLFTNHSLCYCQRGWRLHKYVLCIVFLPNFISKIKPAILNIFIQIFIFKFSVYLLSCIVVLNTYSLK